MTSNISQNIAVRNYFAGLEQVLAGANPQERAEIIDGVREHFNERLRTYGASPTDEQVEEALAALGSPDEVAAAYSQDRIEYAPGSTIPMRPQGGNAGWPALLAAVIGLAFAALNPFFGAFWMLILLVVLITNRKSAAGSPGLYRAALYLTALGLLASLAILFGLISVFDESADATGPIPATEAVIGQEN